LSGLPISSAATSTAPQNPPLQTDVGREVSWLVRASALPPLRSTAVLFAPRG